MNEHKMCCGTVADKVKLCAEIEQRDRVIAAQQRRIEELLAYIERMKWTAAAEQLRGGSNGSNP